MKVGYLAAAALAGAVFSFPAQAQDMDWSGVYLGGTVGYTVTESNAEFVDPALSTFSIPSGQSGLLGGIQAGANFQAGIVVLGVEAGASIGNISATYDDPLLGSPETVTSGSDFQGSLLGRAGLGIGNFLPYVTGGVAVAHVYTTATSPDADDDGMFAGLAYGAGIEVALDDNWSLRGQYLHTDLSGANFNIGKTIAGPGSPSYETSAAPSSDTFTLGVNFRF